MSDPCEALETSKLCKAGKEKELIDAVRWKRRLKNTCTKDMFALILSVKTECVE